MKSNGEEKLLRIREFKQSQRKKKRSRRGETKDQREPKGQNALRRMLRDQRKNETKKSKRMRRWYKKFRRIKNHTRAKEKHRMFTQNKLRSIWKVTVKFDMANSFRATFPLFELLKIQVHILITKTLINGQMRRGKSYY